MDESIFNPQKKLKRTGFYYGPMALVMMFLVAVLIMSLFFQGTEEGSLIASFMLSIRHVQSSFATASTSITWSLRTA